jgi:hypothetical protein
MSRLRQRALASFQRPPLELRARSTDVDGSQRARAWRAAVLLACSLAAGGCRVASAKLWNLDQVHTDDGKIQRSGDVRNDFSHLIRSGGLPFQPRGLFESLGDIGVARNSKIKNPLEVCLENQIELGQCDLSDPATRGQAVAAFAWLATEDEWYLGRERAVIEAAKLARVCDVEVVSVPPPSAATAEDVRAALVELHHAYGVAFGAEDVPAADGSYRSTLTAAQAIERMRALALDLAGARRALAATALLVERAQRLDRLGAGLSGLQQELTRRTLALTLGAALEDRHPRVRAAAFDGVLRNGERPSAEILQRALTREGPAVLLTALRVVQQHGLPRDPPRVLPGAALSNWIALLMHWIDEAPLEDSQRSAAVCRALGAVVDAGLEYRAAERPPLHSQRFEDWTRWWERGGNQLPAGGARAETTGRGGSRQPGTAAGEGPAAAGGGLDGAGLDGGGVPREASPAPAAPVPASKQPRP